MKRLILLSLVLVSFIGTSQVDSIKRPTRKNISAEVTFSPLSNNPINLPYLRLRGFFTQKHAARLGISISGRRDNQDPNTQANTFSYNLRPGYEYHFKGTKHLSPYAGVELDFAMRKSRFETSSPNNVNIIGATNTNGDESSFKRLGGGVLAGLDVYLIKKLYLGLEFGYFISHTSFRDIEITQPSGTTIFPGYKSINYGPAITRTIRLGFFF
jgi:hypothetical protein